MSDEIMNEINDDLRAQQLAAFWKENGNWIIGGALLAVVMTGVMVFWRGYKEDRNMAETKTMLSALSANDPAAIETYAKDADKNHAVIARLSAAAILVQKGEKEKAAAIYDDISKTTGADRSLRDLAALLGVGQKIDTGAPADLHDALKPLMKEKSAFRFSALEMDALVFAREGKMQEAADRLTEISSNAAAPQDARARAYTLRELYMGSGK